MVELGDEDLHLVATDAIGVDERPRDPGDQTALGIGVARRLLDGHYRHGALLSAAGAHEATLRPVGALPARALAVLAALSALAACGGDDEPRPPQVSLAEHQAQVARDPYAFTCADLARQAQTSETQRLVINVEFALAEAPALKARVEEMTGNRVGRSIYWAITEICKRRPGTHRPAREAVAAVQQGKYLVQPRPSSWSKPELWSDPVVKEIRGD
jgi:hypothetical protein